MNTTLIKKLFSPLYKLKYRIGACSFVNKDIPDYCVAAGNPIKIIKRYNFEKQEWIKAYDEHLQK